MAHSSPVLDQRQSKVTYSRLKLLDPAKTPKRVRSHVQLEELIDTIRGKHRDTLARELRLAFARYVRRGHFSINRTAFDYLHGAHCRKLMMGLLSQCSVVTRSHRPGVSAVRRAFTFPGVSRVSQKAPTYSREALTLSPDCTVWVSIPADWMMVRHAHWCFYCELHGLAQRLDFGGATAWGRATLDCLDSIEVPTVSASEHGQETIDRLTDTGVLRMVYRRHGRMYHPLTNVAKVDRRRILIGGQAVAEVDMHAAYTATLAAMLPHADGQPIVDKLRAGAWYAQFDKPYTTFATSKRAEMVAAGCSDEDIAEHLKGPKVEYQRQCLFGSDRRKEATPLFDILRRNHPALAALIDELRQQHGASGLSRLLMQGEGKLFVDGVIPALAVDGVPALGIHDGLVVAVGDSDAAKAKLERSALRELGYVPGVAVT